MSCKSSNETNATTTLATALASTTATSLDISYQTLPWKKQELGVDVVNTIFWDFHQFSSKNGHFFLENQCYYPTFAFTYPFTSNTAIHPCIICNVELDFNVCKHFGHLTHRRESDLRQTRWPLPGDLNDRRQNIFYLIYVYAEYFISWDWPFTRAKTYIVYE
jgi:hypothetical protein